MNYVFASYKVTHKATTGGNNTTTEGYVGTHMPIGTHSVDALVEIVRIIAADHDVPDDAVTLVSFNILRDVVS